MTPHVAAVVAFGVGCLSAAGCHEATFSATMADLSWDKQTRRLAPDMGAACAVSVDNRAWDGSLSAREFWKHGDGFVWVPWYDPSPSWVWAVQIPTGEVGADDSIRLRLSFSPTLQAPIVLGTVHARPLWALPPGIALKMDPTHDLVSVSWWTSGGDGRWSGECLVRLPFRHAPR
jgi:hypothetical protein